MADDDKTPPVSEESEDPEVPGIPTSTFGRTKSLHSVRLKAIIKEEGLDVSEFDVDKLKNGDVLAVRCESSDPFWLCRFLNHEEGGLKVMWLAQQVDDMYTNEFEDVVDARTVIDQTILNEQPDGRFEHPDPEPDRILSILSEFLYLQEGGDDDFGSDHDVADEKPAPKPKKTKPKPKPKRGGRKKAAPKPKKGRGTKRKKDDMDSADDENEPAAKKAKQKKKKKGKMKGVADNSIPVLTSHPTFDAKDSTVHASCCTACSSKEMIRAVKTNNMALFKAALEDYDNVAEVAMSHSLGCPHVTAMTLALEANHTEMIKLFHEHKAPVDPKTNQSRPRPRLPSSPNEVGTGNIGRYLGYRSRKLAQARGGKEGDNAFLKSADATSLAHVFENGRMSPETYRFCLSLGLVCAESIDELRLVGTAIRAGNRKLAGAFVEERMDTYGFNFLHKQALLHDDQDFDPFKKVSVTKKPYGCFSITPIHCAAINPNVKYLTALLESNPEYNLLDQDRRSPMHYAAACESPAPLKFLIEKKCDFRMGDAQEVLPLMIAAKCGRIENIPLLLGDDDRPLINLKDKMGGNTALHYAAMGNHCDCITLLVEKGAKIDQWNKKKHSPLTAAVELGHMEAVKCLVELGCDIQRKDKTTRTPVVVAAMNGQLEILSYLVHMGADPSDADSSGNSATHYAAAYGWRDVLAYLVEQGAPHDCGNDTLTTPLGAAMTKSHRSCADFLLERGANVDYVDNHGRTLVAKACLEQATSSTIERVTYLLTQRKANPNVKDVDGNMALHHLAKFEQTRPRGFSRRAMQTPVPVNKFNAGLVEVLIAGGADVNALNKAGQSPLMVACESFNMPVIELLLRANGKLGAVNVADENILHQMAGRVLEKDTAPLLSAVLASEQCDTSALMEALNVHGYTPFLHCVSRYASGARDLKSLMQTSGGTTELNEKGRAQQRAREFIVEFAKASKVDLGAAVEKLKGRRHHADVARGSTPPLEGTPPLPDEDAEVVPMETTGGGDDNADVTNMETNGETKEKAPYKAVYVGSSCVCNTSPIVGELWRCRECKREFCERCHDKIRTIHEHLVCDIEDYERGHGMFTALHFLVSNMHANDLLLSLLEFTKDGQLDLPDTEGRTALLAACSANNDDAAVALIKKGANVTLADDMGTTPLHVAVRSNRLELVQMLLTAGALASAADKSGNTPLHMTDSVEVLRALLEGKADVNATNTSKCTPLHVVASQSNLEAVQALLAAGADPNIMNNKQRSPLHLAVNASTSSDDYSFDVEQALLEAGCELNAVDYLGRTALHYAFTKAGVNQIMASSSIDPIETVSSLCSRADVQLDVVDKFGKSPLHYAAQRGATICSLHLLQRGASLEAKDKYGNTPLNIGLVSGHAGYAIMLIQKGASVNNMVVVLTRKPAKEKPKEQTPYQARLEREKEIAYNLKHGVPYVVAGKTTTFYQAVSRSWQGVAYMMLDAKFDYRQAMQDAILAGKFQLVATLLRKTSDDALVLRLNKDNQNLFHTLATYTGPLKQWAEKLGSLFLARNMPVDLRDASESCPIHFAAAHHHGSLCKLLADAKVDMNTPDGNKDVPLVLALRGRGGTSCGLKVIELLLKSGAHPNVLYEDKTTYEKETHATTPLVHAIRQKHFALAALLLSHGADVNFCDGSGSSALIHACEGNDDVAAGLLLHGCVDGTDIRVENATLDVDVNSKDAHGRTPLHHAISKNNVGMVGHLLRKSPDLSTVDENNKSIIHYVINPLPYGSYENVKLLKQFAEAGAPLELKDTHGRAPLFYACLQDSGRMVAALAELGVTKKSLDGTGAPLRASSVITCWKELTVDYEDDADTYIQAHKKDLDFHQTPPAVDENSEMQNTHEVYIKDDVPYDLLMTKTDVSYGLYGKNSFYRMQVLRSKAKNIFLVWTRWGRIGEIGQYQRTPFPNGEAACAEFEKIFKSKSGNLWSAEFEFKMGKYKKLDINYSERNLKELIPPFDYSKISVKSRLPENLRESVRKLTDVSALNQAAKQCGVNTDSLPLGSIPKNTIAEARAVLGQIKDVIDKIQALLNATPPDVKKIKPEMQTRADLSSKFYQMIPSPNFKDAAITPISTHEDVNKQMTKLETLSDLEVTAKILMAAHQRSDEVHPLDYCFAAMNTTMEDLPEDGPEYQILQKYIGSTGQKDSQFKIKRIYRIQRRGEAERMQKWKTVPNHYLLWHGSHMSNYLGILNQGLRIAPPEAPQSGFMFGKGIYFADMFQKSVQYCRIGSREGEDTGFLLLSEVALGNFNSLMQPTYMEQAQEGFHSTKGVGRKGPDFDNSIILPNGTVVPIGEVKDTYTAEELNKMDYVNRPQLQHNEYIVYDTTQVRARYMVEVQVR